ncbi:MAG: NAD(+)/NADH kinase [Clostridia bacterium]|nr:NAD(+)/NADH kinase [Clostridia bacterium]
MSKIGIIVNPARDPGLYHLRRVIGELEAAGLRYQVSCCNFETSENYPFCTPEECFEDAKLVLTLGGDGTLLKAAPYANQFHVPLLGINLGHLGFLAELEENEISDLALLLKKDIRCTERMMLKIQVLREENCIAEMIALNDAVLRSRIGKPADIVISDANSDLLDYFCDGFIVATPTGSTAYSMSAGGPILEPSSKSIVVTPICPHTLGSRSVVFDADQKKLYMRVTNADRIQAHLEYDGTDWGVLHDGDIVCVGRHDTPLHLVNIHQKSFYNVLNEKISRRKT